MQIKQLLQKVSERFEEKGLETPLLDARLLLAFVLKKEPIVLKMTPEEEVAPLALEEMERLVLRRLTQEPVSKIIGKRGFWSLDFYVTKDVLDPRADSEVLIEELLRLFPDKTQALNILDLGTGSGCLALSLLQEYKNASAIGFDASKEALKVAQENAVLNGLEARFQTIQGDWFKENWCEAFKQNSFDIVISNPPYIAEEERASLSFEVVGFDPEMALFASQNGLSAYVQIAPKLPKLLKEKGVFICEFGQGQENAVQEIICQDDIKFNSFQKDYGGIIRCLSAIYSK